MATTNDCALFFSKSDKSVAYNLKIILRDLDCELSYIQDIENLIPSIFENKEVTVFLDENYDNYKETIKLFFGKTQFFPKLTIVYIDDNLEKYSNFVNNTHFFAIQKQNLAKEVKKILEKAERRSPTNDDELPFVQVKITKYLMKLGFSPKHIGFSYLKQSLIHIVQNNFQVGNLQKDIYSYIAFKNTTFVMNVERNIRTAIKEAYKRTNFYDSELEGFQLGEITNRFFIAFMVDKLFNSIVNNKDLEN